MELRLDATSEELPVFLAEVDELLQRLDEQLVRLEQDGPSPELLQEVFRAAHTIKGGSAAIGHTRMAHLTHAMGNCTPTPPERPGRGVRRGSVNVLARWSATIWVG